MFTKKFDPNSSFGSQRNYFGNVGGRGGGGRKENKNNIFGNVKSGRVYGDCDRSRNVKKTVKGIVSSINGGKLIDFDAGCLKMVKGNEKFIIILCGPPIYFGLEKRIERFCTILISEIYNVGGKFGKTILDETIIPCNTPQMFKKYYQIIFNGSGFIKKKAK